MQMGMAILVLPSHLDFEDYRTQVLRFLRSNATAQSVEVRFSGDDVRQFWPIIPSPLVDAATEIARCIVTLGGGQQATVILRGVWESPKQVTRMRAAVSWPVHIARRIRRLCRVPYSVGHK